MNLEQGCYYHLYNRSNQRQLVFREPDNYLYFLKNFRQRFNDQLSVFSYCLMPTHFHFLIRVETAKIEELKQLIGSYLDLAGFRDGTLVDRSIIKENFSSTEEFRQFSNRTISSVDSRVWVDNHKR